MELLSIINKYTSNVNLGTCGFHTIKTHSGLCSRDFSSLSNPFIINRYFSTLLKFLASPFSVSVLTFPSSNSYFIQSISHSPPFSKVYFKVSTKTIGGINIKISSPSGSIAPSGISRIKGPVGFTQCLFDIPLPPNNFSSMFLICTFVKSQLPCNLCPSFYGLCLHPQTQLN